MYWYNGPSGETTVNVRYKGRYNRWMVGHQRPCRKVSLLRSRAKNSAIKYDTKTAARNPTRSAQNIKECLAVLCPSPRYIGSFTDEQENKKTRPLSREVWATCIRCAATRSNDERQAQTEAIPLHPSIHDPHLNAAQQLAERTADHKRHANRLPRHGAPFCRAPQVSAVAPPCRRRRRQPLPESERRRVDPGVESWVSRRRRADVGQSCVVR